MSGIFHSAVATDVIVNPAALTGAQRNKIKSRSSTPDVYIDYMPRNTVLGVLTGKGMGRATDDYHVFYPFFSSHFVTPIKPGEVIWVVFPEGNDSPAGIGYWMTRRHAPQTIEDPNYTHLGRFSSALKPVIPNTPAGTPTLVRPDYKVKGLLAFPKGGRGDPQKNTLSDLNDYEVIWGGSIGIEHFTGEPVTRFSKRVGDTVIMGSNNTRIVLGENRQGTTDKMDPTTMDSTPLPGPPAAGAIPRMLQITEGGLRDPAGMIPPGTSPLAVPPLNTGLGTIDIVAGAGQRIIPTPDDPVGPLTSAALLAKVPPPVDVIPPATAATMVMAPPAMNTRNFMENPKVQIVNHIVEDNPHEGDPHFETDLARLYVSMRCNVDADFGIDGHTILEPLSMAAAAPALCSVIPYAAGVGASCVVGHADHIRMIARSTGTIKIVKKGPIPMSGGAGPGDASLIMDPAGNVQICGTTIHMGNSITYGMMAKLPPMGEPYLLHSQIDAILTEITTALTDIATDLTAMQVAMSAMGPMIGGPWAAASLPPALAAAGAGILAPVKIAKAVLAVTALKVLMGSTTIYGA